MSAAELFAGSPYVGYAYSYPHKTAHRPLDPPRPLGEVWAREDKSSLFLYVHVPFCEMRCGFCNLLTTTGADRRTIANYLDALARQAAVVREELGPARFARMAVGGGTPTVLEPVELERLFDIVKTRYAARPTEVPTSVETSPRTATPERLAVLEAAGVRRVSIGVQAFDERDARALGRPQRAGEVAAALDAIRARSFAALNIDLMYGGEGQSLAGWLESIDRALSWQPEELYLYPLYVRRLTALGKRARSWDDERLEAYRRGRDHLRSAGYEQLSMRLFRRRGPEDAETPPYRCQEDGMLGLGCGARSYTTDLHYSWPYAVERQSVRAIIAAYAGRTDAQFAVAHHGIELDRTDQARRFVLMSLLQAEGLDVARYRSRFCSDPFDELPALGELVRAGLAARSGGALLLTASGMERSDAIGPWLYSTRVTGRMESFQWR